MAVNESFQRFKAYFSRTDLVSRALFVALLTTLVFGLERLLPFVALFDHGWSVWWPTNGITLALMLLSRRIHWPYILFSVSVATALGQPLGAGSLLESLSIALANGLEVLIPAMMLPRFQTLEGWLQESRLVRSFVVSAILLGPALSSLVMGSFYFLADHRAFWPMVLRWGVSDIVGIVMFTPLVLVLITPQLYALFRPARLPSTLSIFALLLASSWIVFYRSPLPVSFAISPVLLLVAARCGFSGSVLAINLLAPIATAATLHGHGPFSLIQGEQDIYRVVVVQIFFILGLLMLFPITVAKVQQECTAMRLQQACAQMEELATADPLTGLANRRRFDAALQAEWRRAMRESLPVAVLMLDADNFKSYNDRYGHPAGDLCLQSLARAICDIPQRGGDLVARYGGEEFVILLPGVDGEGSYSIAEQVRYNVSMLNLPHTGSSTGRVSISVGCASTIPKSAHDRAALLEGADRALYVAKQSGRDRTVLHSWEEQTGSESLPTGVQAFLNA